MQKSNDKGDRKAIVLLSSLGGVIGGLCCLTPIVMVMFGLASVSFAASLGNVLYGDYRWVFRGVALLLLAGGLFAYFRAQGICTLDAARRQRNRILNMSLIALLGSVGVYIFWTYIVLHYWGIAAGLPWAQYDETWAIPASAAVLGVAALLAYYLRRAQAGSRSRMPARVESIQPTHRVPS